MPPLRERSDMWLAAKERATAPAAMAFYRKRDSKLITFFGPRADGPVTRPIRADLIALPQ